MSQFDSPEETFPTGDEPAPAPRTSALAIVALISSLIFFCPLTTLLGPILGLVALVKINPARNERGRGLAIAAIIIGILLTLGWGVVIKRGYDFFADIVGFMMDGPQQAMEYGFDGNYNSFRDHFRGRGAETTDAEVRLFLDTLTDRYGEFVAFKLDEAAGPAQPAPGQQVFTMPYRIQFEQQTLNADVEFTAEPERPGQMPKLRIASIVIYDEDEGDMRYPMSRDANEDDLWDFDSDDDDDDNES